MAETDDRFTKGKKSIEMLVIEIPSSCKSCPYYIKNINKDNLKDPSYYCLLRSALVSAQYGGTDVAVPKQYVCPLLELEEAEPFKALVERVDAHEETLENHEERITRLEGFHA